MGKKICEGSPQSCNGYTNTPRDGICWEKQQKGASAENH